MRLELLVSTMNADPRSLVNKMNVSSDAIIINQTDHTSFESFSFKGHNIRVWSFAEKGIGISRNNALMRSNADVVLFADDDAILVDDYEQKIIEEFDRKPESDFIIVNYDVKCTNGRKGAISATKRKRVHWWNSQRYGTCRFAIRRDKVIKKNIFFSLLYGASKYSHGEDSIFIMDCLKNQLKVYTSNINVGVLDCNNSSWFNSYNEKYFFDTGALMYAINPFFYKLFILVTFFRHRKVYCDNISFWDSVLIAFKGANDAK